MIPKCIVLFMDLVIDKSETDVCVSLGGWVQFSKYTNGHKSYSKCLLSYRQGE